LFVGGGGKRKRKLVSERRFAEPKEKKITGESLKANSTGKMSKRGKDEDKKREKS